MRTFEDIQADLARWRLLFYRATKSPDRVTRLWHAPEYAERVRALEAEERAMGAALHARAVEAAERLRAERAF